MKYLLICALALTACTPKTNDPAPPSPPVSPSPIISSKLDWANDTWTQILVGALDANDENFLKAGDLTRICANIRTMTKAERTNALAHFFVAIAKFESSYNPNTRYTETSMGIDPVTGKQVVSEGLFQLSYQDEQWAKCGFDFSKKNILDPKLNILCAVKIMAGHAQKKWNGGFAEIFLYAPYWAVIRDGDRLAPKTGAPGEFCAWQINKKTGKNECRYTKLPAILERVKNNVPNCK